MMKNKPTFLEKFKKAEWLIYLLPFAFGVVFFTLYPIINVFLTSFKEGFNYITKTYTGWGLGNYVYVMNDPYFIQALKNTLGYVCIVIPVSTCLAILIATLLNQKIKFSGLFQTAYFVPMVTSTIAVGFCWRFMFSHKYGIINYLLGFLNIPSINWLGDPKYNFYALCIYGIWAVLPFTIILLLSGLQNIDPMYYTVAKVDGAGPIRTFFRVTVPLLAPTIFMVIMVNTISCFKVFNELFPLFGGGQTVPAGAANNLFTVVLYIYYQFRGKVPSQYGYASAAAVILFLIIFVVTMFQRFVEKKIKN
ncbi:MAG: sugar ABC transporter permease [Erysipelotrichaceae bacterium]|nr:sugar ABC transporter permease [Erysipelotrichaceae bacterium]